MPRQGMVVHGEGAPPGDARELSGAGEQVHADGVGDECARGELALRAAAFADADWSFTSVIERDTTPMD